MFGGGNISRLGNHSTDIVKFDEKQDVPNEILKSINSYDAKMIKYLKKLYDYIGGEKMDLDGIMNVVDVLSKFNEKMKYNYLNVLLHPEKNKCVKIPSPIPVPSCSFQLHNCVTLTTNNMGNLAFTFNPYFLYDSNFKGKVLYEDNSVNYNVDFFSTLQVNYADSLDGRSYNDNFVPLNIGQDIPNVYAQYRLVSASVVVKYIGRLDIVSGVCGGAIVFDDDRRITGQFRSEATSNPARLNSDTVAKYGNFDLAMDSFYHQENLCLDGLRMLYFPVDNSYEEYVKLFNYGDENVEVKSGVRTKCTTDEDRFKNGFKFLGYVMGAPPSSACFKLDIYCNFECLPNPEFLNYMPSSTGNYAISPTEKQGIISTVQKNAIMKANDIKNAIVSTSSPWQNFVDKFRNKIPGMLKLVGSGVLNYLLPAAGNILNPLASGSDSMNTEDIDE